MRILILEDDARDAKRLTRDLNELGHEGVTWMRTKDDVEKKLEEIEPEDFNYLLSFKIPLASLGLLFCNFPSTLFL